MTTGKVDETRSVDVQLGTASSLMHPEFLTKAEHALRQSMPLNILIQRALPPSEIAVSFIFEGHIVAIARL